MKAPWLPCATARAIGAGKLLLANAGVLRATGASAPDAWRRFAALMVDAFRARPETPPPPAPPEQQLRRSIALLTEGR